MRLRSGPLVAVLLCLPPAGALEAAAVELAPSRAVYATQLSSAKPDSGVVGADGTMAVELGEACDGWTVSERDKLVIHYSEEGDVEMTTSFTSWESKDGLRFRFAQRESKNGALDEEIMGEARLAGPGKGGTVEFTKPKSTSMELPPGVLFPTGHTIRLIEGAEAGEPFIAAKVFDGTSAENAADVTAVIGAPLPAGAGAGDAVTSPLLARPSWHAHLAFFPSDAHVDHPDYEIGMRLLDNGVARDMVLDYGDFAIKATLDKLEELPKPGC